MPQMDSSGRITIMAEFPTFNNEKIKEKFGMAHVKVKMAEFSVRGLRYVRDKTNISLGKSWSGECNPFIRGRIRKAPTETIDWDQNSFFEDLLFDNKHKEALVLIVS